MSKLNAFINKIATANGQAQIVSYSFWGVLMAGMLWDFCDGCLPNLLILVWGIVSFAVLPCAIWCERRVVKGVLLLDMLLSSVIMMIYFMHEPHYVAQMVYQVKSDGSYTKMEHSISEWFTAVALVWMTLHSVYLANLIQRQELETKRLHNGL